MGDRAGDSFRGWVYALGLCGGWGVLGLLVCLSLRFSTYSLAGGWDVGLLEFGDGEWGFVGGVFRFGNELFGATYHLRDECHILNILWGDGV